MCWPPALRALPLLRRTPRRTCRASTNSSSGPGTIRTRRSWTRCWPTTCSSCRAKPTTKGKAEVADKWIQATLGTIADLKTYAASSGNDAQLAYEAGTFSAEVLPETPGAPHGVGEGNFVLLWKRGADSKWKLSYAQLEDLPVQVKN